jgi:hypothetical protein
MGTALSLAMTLQRVYLPIYSPTTTIWTDSEWCPLNSTHDNCYFERFSSCTLQDAGCGSKWIRPFLIASVAQCVCIVLGLRSHCIAVARRSISSSLEYIQILAYWALFHHTAMRSIPFPIQLSICFQTCAFCWSFLVACLAWCCCGLQG